ncbi:hypothetical protein CRYUN_Cryun11dG0045400 [Craigia yunnanensis]
MEFNEALTNNEARNQAVNIVWSPLTKNILKLNVDASFSIASGKSKSGMVVRDLTGKICLSAVSREEGADVVLHAETQNNLAWLRDYL